MGDRQMGATWLRRALTVCLLLLAACKSGDGCAKRSEKRPLWVMAPHGLDSADIDGDAVEDVVGLCNDSPEGDVSFCAFRGSDDGLLWRYGSFKHDVAHAAHVVVMGSRAVLIDPMAEAHIVSLADGTKQASVVFPDRPKLVCRPAAQPDRLWLQLADNSERQLDLTTGVASEAARPADCRGPGLGDVSTCYLLRGVGLEDQRCRYLPLPPKADDFLPREVVYDGSVGALLGIHTTGTGYPIMVGFEVDASGAALSRFKRPLADGSPLADSSVVTSGELAAANGRIFAKHGDDLLAVDAATGKTLWRVQPGSFMYVHAGGSVVYVGRWTALAIFDAATGKAVGMIGERRGPRDAGR